MNSFKLVLIFLVSFVALFFLSIPEYSGDVWNHLVWAKSILDHGPFGFYERTFKDIAFPNYPPLAMLFFVISLEIYQIIYQLAWLLNQNLGFFPSNIIYFLESNNVRIAFLKIPTILAPLILSFLLYKLLPKISESIDKKVLLLSCIFLVLNPAIFYLSIVWGQIDLIPIMFIVLSCYFLFQKNIYLSSLFAAFALLTKQTVIIFWLIELLFMIKILGVKKTALSAALVFLLMYFSYIPFLGLNPVDMIELYQANFTYVAQLTQVNSINIWGFLYDFQPLADKKLFLGISYNTIGKILFLTALLPLLALVFFAKLKTLNNSTRFYLLTYIFFITTSLYFIFLTRMHERYLIPAVLFAHILICFRKFHILNLVFFTLLTFTNLYRGLLEPDISWMKNLVFSIAFLGLLFNSYFLITLHNLLLFVRTMKGKLSLQFSFHIPIIFLKK